MRPWTATLLAFFVLALGLESFADERPPGSQGTESSTRSATTLASARTPDTELPSDIEYETPELRVLLSSIDMTVSLIDAYGQCREQGEDHGVCILRMRATLEHARSMIGR